MPVRRDLIHDHRLARLAAFVTGGSCVLAFSPFEWRLFSLLSPMLLMLLWQGQNARETFLRGYCWGVGFFLLGVSWVFVSMRVFGGAPLWLGGGLTALFVAFLALAPALTGYLAHRYLPENRAYRLLLAYPALWVLFEWIRSWILTGFPWLLLGDAQVDTPLSSLIPIFGELGATWAICLLAGMAAYLVSAKRGRWAVLSLAVLASAAVWSAGSLRWTHPEGDAISVALIQGNIDQQEKWDPEGRARAMALYRDLTRAHWDADLIVWPETAIAAYYLQAQEFIEGLDAEARAQDSMVLTGVFRYDAENDLAYNALMSLGDERHYYSKRHLVPFGEYMPFRFVLNWLDRYLDIPMADLSPGEGRPLMQFDRYSVGLSICYEDAYGVEMIDALPEADFLINVSNDAWFGDSLAPHQHLELARVRAVETGRYLLRATNTGISAVIAPDGKVTARSPQFVTHVVKADIHRMQGLTPFAQYGRKPIVALMIFLLGGGYLVLFVQAARRESNEFA